MNKFNYNFDISNSNVLKTESEQSQFFSDGHPKFYILHFSEDIEDIWTSYINYLEEEIEEPMYDQDGGEITHKEIIDKGTGLTRVTYTAYGIQMFDTDDPQDVDIIIEGYIIDDERLGVYFLATSVEEFYKSEV